MESRAFQLQKKKIIRKFVGVKRTILYLEYDVDHTGQHLIKFIKVLLNWYILSINCIHNIFYKALHILDIKPSAKLELEACCNNLLPLNTRKVSKKRIREYNQVLRGKKKKKHSNSWRPESGPTQRISAPSKWGP